MEIPPVSKVTPVCGGGEGRGREEEEERKTGRKWRGSIKDEMGRSREEIQRGWTVGGGERER